MGSSFGDLFRISTFGESHGGGVGVIVEGCPPRLELDLDEIQAELNRRKPGQSHITTPRKEADQVEILSGLLDGKTTLGTPIAMLVRNKDQRPGDYSDMAVAFRPSHADATYQSKYGIQARSGGGRASARETIGRVAAGAIAKQLLRKAAGTEILAWVKRIHSIEAHGIDPSTVSMNDIEANIVRCPEASATKGFEIGSGFSGTLLKGSEHNDAFIPGDDGRLHTATNNSGGIQGGISNGEPIVIRVGFKPTATIRKEQQTIDSDGNATTLAAKGRHDPCVLPRAVPMVEAMVALTLADHLLRQQGQCSLW